MLRKINYIITLALIVFLGSCTKSTFDINADPNNPTALPAKVLLPQIIKNMGDASAIGSPAGSNDIGISTTLEVYMHRISVRESPNAYGVTGSSGYVEGMWDIYYSRALTNLDIIIDAGTKDGNLRYSGIAKILKAFIYSQLVDVFGDVPFSEVNKLNDAILNPKFDDDATIYPALLTMIDDGIADVTNTTPNPVNPGAEDLFYKGSVSKWVKLANTLKLKLYTQQRKVKDVSAEVKALLASPATLISSTADNFQVPYTKDDQNPGYEDYGAAQRTKYISPWFYEIMKGYNQHIFTDITDPRTKYYWFNQLKPGQENTNDGNPLEYRDGPFVTIYFGSNGPNSGFAQQSTMTVLGIYPVGGKYDDESGGSSPKLSASSSTGAAPYRFITYADRLFLEAELIKEGIATGDVTAVTLAAIKESFKMVDEVVKMTGVTGVPALANSDAANTYIDKVMAEFAANPGKQLEIIMTQKWISSFGSAVDAYSDYRRTGFPVIWNPNNPAMAPGGFAQPPVNGNPLVDPQPKVPVSSNRDFPLSLPWPKSELDVNSNAPEQKTPSTYKVFWQP